MLFQLRNAPELHFLVDGVVQGNAHLAPTIASEHKKHQQSRILVSECFLTVFEKVQDRLFQD